MTDIKEPSDPVKPYAKPSTSLALALAYVAKHPGRKLFPCKGKSGPCFKDNLARASNDPAQLTAWAKEFAAPDFLWACSPKVSGIFCIDVDTGIYKKTGKPKIGAASWKVLRDEVARADGVQLAGTERNTTPSGGAHFIFEGVHKLSIGKLGRTPDLPPDVSSNLDCPNYFMIPGQGGYTVKADIPAMKAPPRLQALVKPPRPERNREPSGDAIPLDIFRKMLGATKYSGGPAGLDDRHTYLGWLSFMFAVHDAAAGNEGDYLQAFIDWSVSDPKQDDWTDPTSPELIEYKWQTITDAELVPAAAITRGSWIEYLKASGNGVLAAQAAASRTTAEDDFTLLDVDGPPLDPNGDFNVDPEIVEDGKRRNRMKGRTFAELELLPDPKFMVRDMIPEDCLFLIYGKPKRGKTFWTLEFVLCKATGTLFFGESLGPPARVIYVAAEGGAAAIRNRIRAWCKARKVDPAKLGENFLLVDTGVMLNSTSSVKNFLALHPGEWSVVIFDTLARCMNGDENSAKDVGAMIKGCDYIREQIKGSVGLVHHEGWSAKRVRGSSALQGAPDAVIRVARDDGNVTTVLAEDMRECAPGRRMDFMLDPKIGVLTILSAEAMAARTSDDKALTTLGNLQSANDGQPVKSATWRAGLVAAELVDGDPDKSTGRVQFGRIVAAAVKSKRVKKLAGDLFELRVGRDDLNDNASTSDDREPVQ
jgi:hypothetical protein